MCVARPVCDQKDEVNLLLAFATTDIAEPAMSAIQPQIIIMYNVE